MMSWFIVSCGRAESPSLCIKKCLLHWILIMNHYKMAKNTIERTALPALYRPQGAERAVASYFWDAFCIG